MTLAEHLRRLPDFSGRDRRGAFWPYVGVIVAGGLVAMGLAMSAFVIPVLLAVEAGDTPNILVVMSPFGLTVLAFVGLLAATVARRLHDRGLSGWWGLPPVLLLMVGVVAFGMEMNAVLAGDDIEDEVFAGLFALLFLVNVLYIASLAALTILLCMPGQPRPNRYGPPPK
ncbi:MAG: DUF805 domain-containing protein [Brevundimonas sp.]|uniref:DUF805 domain-containing protein n=1 Tax=Brevundimonas sp. TaxID=1871086 RepID=UPI004033B5DD